MFACGACGRQSKPREKQRRVVVQRRAQHYVNVLKKPRRVIESDGWEIVREVGVAQCCPDFPERDPVTGRE